MRSALLRGREHREIGEIDTIAEGSAAIAISAGGAKKTYPHTDPNEDCALFAVGEGGWLVAVADGHSGFEASEVVLEHIASHPAPQWTDPAGVSPDSWRRHALAVLCDANAHILQERAGEIGASRTTLALALVSPASRTLLYAAIGDSHIFEVRAGAARDLAAGGDRQGNFFLGHGEETVESLAPRCAVGCADLAGVQAVVLATDGLSERDVGVSDPAAAVCDAVRSASASREGLAARDTARTVVETALAAHRHNPSGDNIASAVIWLGGG